MDAFTGEIRAFAFSYAPENWAMCNGQTVAVSQLQTLASVIGNLYGGQPTRTFCLPQLQGQAPMAAGDGIGLSPRSIGDASGAEGVTLNQTQIPAHDHTLTAYATGTQANMAQSPSNAAWLSRYKVMGNNLIAENFIPGQPNTTMASAAIAPAYGNVSGGVDPHENRQPYLALNFCICLDGIYPVRPS